MFDVRRGCTFIEMGSENPVVNYLRDVLGVRGLPKGSVSAAPAYDVAILTSRPLTDDEKTLAEKMLRAIDCRDILWSDDPGSSELGRARGVVAFGVKHGGFEGENADRVLHLPGLAEFFGSDAKVRELKKSAWEQLKKFKQSLLVFIAFISIVVLSKNSNAQTAMSAVPASATAQATQCVLETKLDNVIGPASLDLVQRAKRRAIKNNCGSVLLLINTPGGNLQTTRLIVEEILNSPVPFLCFVYPPGGHAGSAGAIILQSCHLAGAAEGTNIGAATPIEETGANIPSDLRKKILNDTVAWVTSLAHLRGRNEKFAEDIIRQAKAVSADDALKLKAIEFVGATPEDFLKFAVGRTIRLEDNREVELRPGRVILFSHDLRFKVMDILMNPQVAYFLLMGSLGLLYFEITHPGFVAPGVIGGLGLILALSALHMMDVTWGAVLLILSGIGLLIAEAFMPTFGIVGFGGIVAFFIGSLFLFDYGATGFSLPLSVILPTVIFLGALLLGIAYLAFSYRKRRKLAGFGALIGILAKVTDIQAGDAKHGYVEVEGELWRFESDEPLTIGQEVRIMNHKGFTLQVARANGADASPANENPSH